MVPLRLRHLRTVVGRYVVGEGMIDAFKRYVVHIAYGNGGQHVVQIVGSNEVGLYLHPFALITSIAVLLAPAELQEGSAADDLATNQNV